MSWHDRPVLAPVVYFTGALTVGLLSYTGLYFFSQSIRIGVYAALIMDGLLVLYLRESHRVARMEEK